MDRKFSTLGFTAFEKNRIYMVLSAILNLGNIEFEPKANVESCSIEIGSRDYLSKASASLNIKEDELEDALICHTREVGIQQIK